jgi:CheY-like chemotaxis protein
VLSNPPYSDTIVVKSDMEEPIIIVLEDNEFSANVIRRTLELSGFHCVEVQTEKEMLAACRRHGDRVRAIIADLVLPECRGTDVALAGFGQRPGLPVLFISGTPFESWPASDARKLCALPSGTTAFLGKPFHPHGMMEKLSALMEASAETLRPAGPTEVE